MKRTTLQQVVPALIMAGAAGIPVVTTVEILTHVPGGGMAAVQPSAPVAAAPPTSSSRGSGTPPSSPAGTHTYQGPVVSDPFGGVQATITITGNKIADVVISAPQDNPRSASINQQAVPLLRSETLQAQSAQINTISGATLTGQAYIQSLQAVLSQAHVGSSSQSQGTGGGSVASGQAPSISISGDD